MPLNFRMPFCTQRERPVVDRTEAARDAVRDPIPAPKRPVVLLCASRRLRERLAGSSKFEFIPCGNTVPEIPGGITRSSINGVLIQYEAGNDKMSEFIEAAGKNFQDLPFLILCNQNDPPAIAQYAWQSIVIRDITSLLEIEEKLQRGLFLFPWMKREPLRRTLGMLKTIPAEAASHQRIAHELQNPQFDLKNIAGLIKQDPALTAQLLKIVNSPAFSRGIPIQNVDEAVLMLGALKLQALVASAWAFFLIDDNMCRGFHPRAEWEHAVTIAERVRRICEEEQVSSAMAETAIIAAMLHDLGKLLLAANRPCDYAVILENVETKRTTSWEVENWMFGFNHAEIAGCLLGLWGVPLPVAEAVMLHHAENVDPASVAAIIQKAHVPEPDSSLPKNAA